MKSYAPSLKTIVATSFFCWAPERRFSMWSSPSFSVCARVRVDRGENVVPNYAGQNRHRERNKLHRPTRCRTNSASEKTSFENGCRSTFRGKPGFLFFAMYPEPLIVRGSVKTVTLHRRVAEKLIAVYRKFFTNLELNSSYAASTIGQSSPPFSEINLSHSLALEVFSRDSFQEFRPPLLYCTQAVSPKLAQSNLFSWTAVRESVSAHVLKLHGPFDHKNSEIDSFRLFRDERLVESIHARVYLLFGAASSNENKAHEVESGLVLSVYLLNR